MKVWKPVVAALVGGAAVLWFAINERPAQADGGSRSEPAEPPLAAPLSEQDQEGASPLAPLVGVDEFMRNVDRYEKAARVQGVVSAADADQGVLALIDAGEFQACQRTTCAKLALPVRWSKDMPGVAETVVVTGSVQGSAGSRIFVASRLERGALEQQRDK